MFRAPCVSPNSGFATRSEGGGAEYQLHPLAVTRLLIGDPEWDTGFFHVGPAFPPFVQLALSGTAVGDFRQESSLVPDPSS